MGHTAGSPPVLEVEPRFEAMENSSEKPFRLSAGSAFRYLGLAGCFCFLIASLSVGTMESRVLYALGFLLSWLNPVWGFYSIVIMGPLCLLDQGKTHILIALEVLTVGILAGELRLLGQDKNKQVDDQPPIAWGVWPHYLAGMFLILAASSLIGLQLTYLREDFVAGVSGWLYRIVMVFAGSATNPEWAVKSLWNWGTGMLVAVVAARRMDVLAAARWIKLGAAGMVVACLLGLVDWASLQLPGLTRFNLSDIRLANPDPVQMGRLQGTAGHPGWFAQWIVAFWAGLILWWRSGQLKRNGPVIVAIGLVALALVLSAARAAWLATLVAASVGIVAWVRHYPTGKKILPILIITFVGVLLVSMAIGGEAIANRLVTFLRTSDRTNYYVSGLVFLREFPFGIGLGTHYLFYGATFPPGWRWAQADYVDSHNLWLHTLIETGPFIPLLIMIGIVGIVLEVRKSWFLLKEPHRPFALAFSLSLIGLAVVAIAQYIVYIRAVELTIWIMVGSLVGMCRSVRTRYPEQLESPYGRRILLLCGIFAIIVASTNAHRVYAGNYPRIRELNEEGNIAMWTGTSWRTVVDRDIDQIEFSLLRKAIPVSGSITWPDGTVEEFTMEPGPLSAPYQDRDEWKFFKFGRHPRESNWYDPPEFLRIDVSPLWSPVNFLPDNTDSRQLGVYINGLKMTSPAIRSELRGRERSLAE